MLRWTTWSNWPLVTKLVYFQHLSTPKSLLHEANIFLVPSKFAYEQKYYYQVGSQKPTIHIGMFHFAYFTCNYIGVVDIYAHNLISLLKFVLTSNYYGPYQYQNCDTSISNVVNHTLIRRTCVVRVL